MKASNEDELTGLAEANVRMVLLMSFLENMRSLEKDLFSGGDIEYFYELFLTELRLLSATAYVALGVLDSNGSLTEFITDGINNEIKEKIGSEPVGKGLLAEVYHTKNYMKVDNISQHPKSCGFPDGHPHMTTLLAMPVKVNGKFHAVIYLSDKNNGEVFNESDEEVLKLIIAELEQILERKKLLSQLAMKNLQLSKERNEQTTLMETINEIQSQLLQSEKMASIGQLAAGVAHEINNPVGYINSNISSLDGYIQDLLLLIENVTEASKSKEIDSNMLNELKDDIDYDFIKDDVSNLLSESKEGVSRVIKIVKDLKDFSHVDEEEWQWADIHKGIESTLNVVNNEIKYKAEVIKDFSEIPEVECIISQLNQVFMNLVVNASHAIDKQGTITIKTEAGVNDMVLIKISDTGSGIKKENLKKLFDPFFSTKPVGQGTGLGLSLSYSIINKHGGAILVDSELGKGTTFTIRLPVKQPQNDSEE